MKALLLQVGLDKQSAGAYGPIFEDGSFEYIPKPDENEKIGPVTYNQRLGRKRLPLAVYLPRTLKNAVLDENPNFSECRFTFAPSTRVNLTPLKRGDLIVFYAGLQPFHTDIYGTGLYIIGYFTVEDISAAHDAFPSEMHDRRSRIARTDSMSSRMRDTTLIIGVEGNSKLLDVAIPLANPVMQQDKRAPAAFAPHDEMVERIGLRRTIKAEDPPIWIRDQENVNNLRLMLGLL